MSTATQPSTVIATREKVATLRTLLEKSKEQIAMALPKHCTPERMLRVAMTAAQRTPRLLNNPRSVIACVVQASQLGLEPDGVLGHAYLIPFHNKKTGQDECQLIPGYKGLIDLCRRSGQVSTIYAKVVHEKDRYDMAYGLNPKLEHKPSDAEKPGQVIAAYAVCHLRDGGVQYEWMWRREIEAIRNRSPAGKAGPWVTDYEEMCKKTVLRRLCKMLPVSVEFQRFVAGDEQFDAGVQPTVNADFSEILEEPEAPPSQLDTLADRLDAKKVEPTTEAPSGEEKPPSTEEQKPPPADTAEWTPEIGEKERLRIVEQITTRTRIGEVQSIERTLDSNDRLTDEAREALVKQCMEKVAQIRAKRGAGSNTAANSQTDTPLLDNTPDGATEGGA